MNKIDLLNLKKIDFFQKQFIYIDEIVDLLSSMIEEDIKKKKGNFSNLDFVKREFQKIKDDKDKWIRMWDDRGESPTGRDIQILYESCKQIIIESRQLVVGSNDAATSHHTKDGQFKIIPYIKSRYENLFIINYVDE
jgi:hypothetical protein